MRAVYNTILYSIYPFLAVTLKRKARRQGAQALQRCSERFGIYASQPLSQTIWFHAVSVGEVMVALPLIQAVQNIMPNCPIVLTTMTRTGSALAQQKMPEGVTHVYAPLDAPHTVKRFLRHFNPVMCVILETELWPNVLYYTKRANAKLMLANARLSEKTCKHYRWVSPLSRLMMRQFDCVMAQSNDDASRFKSLGLRENQLTVSGNIKFDIKISVSVIESGQLIRKNVGDDRLILIAASTHEGEDDIILDAFDKIHKRLPSALLILVPRHPERFDAAYQLCLEKQFAVQRRSEMPSLDHCVVPSERSSDDAISLSCSALPETTQVLLLDSVGELMNFYAASDVAFVGGTLVNVGGHNLVEPATLGLPILVGPHLKTCRHIASRLEAASVLAKVSSANELSDKAQALLNKPLLRASIGVTARSVIEENKGALDRHVNWVGRQLN